MNPNRGRAPGSTALLVVAEHQLGRALGAAKVQNSAGGSRQACRSVDSRGQRVRGQRFRRKHMDKTLLLEK
jgi:hypothetical protein